MMTDEEFEREAAWRELAQSLYMRLSECQPVKLGNMTALPKLPSQDELEAYATRFRALSTAGGWTSSRRPDRRRWWWPF
jgi:hypothetical protein